MRIISSLFALLVLAGCTTTMKPGGGTGSKIKNVDYKNYSIGVQSLAYVGEQVVSRKKYQSLVKKNMFQAKNDFALKGGVATTSINLRGDRGDTFHIAGTNEYGNPVVHIPGSQFMFGIDKSGRWDKTVMSPSFWTSPIGSGQQYTMTPAITTFKAVESQTPIPDAGYVNHEIVFTGIGANGISLLYREYTFENMARSDFKQELVYPLDSKEIRFRNYLIKLTSVTPSEIKYTVIRD